MRIRPSWAWGAAAGLLLTNEINHLSKALAVGLKATTQPERIGAVLFGLFVLFALIWVFRRLFGASFSNGFIVASGLFFSLDILVFHWVFQLHRITSGPEADVLEPALVLLGAGMTAFAVRRESAGR